MLYYSLLAVSDNSKLIEIGDLIIDKDNFRVSKSGQQFLLPKKEFDLLYLLASNTEKVFKREEILEKCGKWRDRGRENDWRTYQKIKRKIRDQHDSDFKRDWV